MKVCLFRKKLHEHFQVNSKVLVEDVLFKNLRMVITKKHGRIIFVILHFILLIGLLFCNFVVCQKKNVRQYLWFAQFMTYWTK